jgi:broad specificity phosphatase PhoE
VSRLNLLAPRPLSGQAQRVAQSLASSPPVDAIVCSPWLRSLQTVAPLAAALGLPIHVDRGFGERSHRW